MGSLLVDVRHAVRALLKVPVFTAVTVVTLALGIGANSAIFSLVDAVLLRPLGYVEPERLLLIYEGFRAGCVLSAGASGGDGGAGDGAARRVRLNQLRPTARKGQNPRSRAAIVRDGGSRIATNTELLAGLASRVGNLTYKPQM